MNPCKVCERTLIEQQERLYAMISHNDSGFGAVEDIDSDIDGLVFLTHAGVKGEGLYGSYYCKSPEEAVDSYITELVDYIHPRCCGENRFEYNNYPSMKIVWRERPIIKSFSDDFGSWLYLVGCRFLVCKKDDTEKVYCDECKFYCRVMLSESVEDCNCKDLFEWGVSKGNYAHRPRKVIVSRGEPKVQNKNNDCGYFEEK